MTGSTGFESDSGNAVKNWETHGVTRGEAEQVFFNRPVRVAPTSRGQPEHRYAALGQTTNGRLLTVVLTIRRALIRVISARDMSRRERRLDERQEAC